MVVTGVEDCGGLGNVAIRKMTKIEKEIRNRIQVMTPKIEELKCELKTGGISKSKY